MYTKLRHLSKTKQNKISNMEYNQKPSKWFHFHWIKCHVYLFFFLPGRKLNFMHTICKSLCSRRKQWSRKTLLTCFFCKTNKKNYQTLWLKTWHIKQVYTCIMQVWNHGKLCSLKQWVPCGDPAYCLCTGTGLTSAGVEACWDCGKLTDSLL